MIRWLLLWDHNAGLICVMRRKKEQKKDCVGRVSDSEKGLGSWWGEETQSRDFLLEALDMGQKWLTLVSTLAVHTHGWEAAWSLLFWYLHSSNIYRGTMSVLLGLIFTYLLCMSLWAIHPLTASTFLVSFYHIFLHYQSQLIMVQYRKLLSILFSESSQ